MALANVRELLEALAKRDTWSRLTDEQEVASLAWLKGIKTTQEWNRKINATPGVDRLAIYCRSAGGGKLNHDWAAEQHATLIIERRCKQSEVDSMNVDEFLSAISGGKALEAKKRGRPAVEHPDTAAMRDRVKSGEDPAEVAADYGIEEASLAKSLRRRGAKTAPSSAKNRTKKRG